MKQKTALCSTGHGTGVLLMRAPSWRVKVKQNARRVKKVLTRFRYSRDAPNPALEAMLGRRHAERAKPIGFLAKLKSAVARVWNRGKV